MIDTQNWPVWAIIIYLLIKDVVPSMFGTLNKAVSVITPAKMKQAQDKQNHEQELEERRIDLREREVVALEQIGKNLVIIDTRLQFQDKTLSTIMAGVSVANNALAVMIDRVHRRREDYVEHSHPTPPREPETIPNKASND